MFWAFKASVFHFKKCFKSDSLPASSYLLWNYHYYCQSRMFKFWKLMFSIFHFPVNISQSQPIIASISIVCLDVQIRITEMESLTILTLKANNTRIRKTIQKTMKLLKIFWGNSFPLPKFLTNILIDNDDDLMW